MLAQATLIPFNLPHQRRALVSLGALVLGVHLWLLMSPGASIWRLQPESQKLGPLQTRVLSSGVSQAPPQSPATQQTRPSALQKPRAAATASDSSPSSAGMSAVASAVLSAPEENPAPPNSDLDTAALPNSPSSLPEVQAIALPPDLSATPSVSAPLVSNALSAKVGDFPPNTQINYRLTGQERGLTYHASGSLKWQTQSTSNTPKAYESELRVKAFLVGSRVWRSVGTLTENGLAPVRYSDSWRGERAAHFEAAQKKISFSGNTPSIELQSGAQDQVSLFIQMAATVSANHFKLGSVLNVQTATARDAVNWTLTYKSDETIEVNGNRLETQRWVCLPRAKFDSQIEMWLSQAHSGMPVRIKITQVNGNFIDMEMRDAEPLPALPS